MIAFEETLAIPPADIDLAPEVPPFVDGRRLLYAEEEETAIWMMSLEEERVQLSNPEDHV
jgi:hypothetical protein